MVGYVGGSRYGAHVSREMQYPLRQFGAPTLPQGCDGGSGGPAVNSLYWGS